MALHEVTPSEFRRIPQTDFHTLALKERGDIQRLLRNNISVIADDLYVLAEEFSEWEDNRRRIDLLAIDSNANLVVIEVKRTTEGGAMDLQATRYAAMVSALSFARAIQIHTDFLRATGQDPTDAQSRILEFLDWE